MRRYAVVIVAALIVIPPGAKAADLVVRWRRGSTPRRTRPVAEVVAAFEQGTHKRVELELGEPPDFAFGPQPPR